MTDSKQSVFDRMFPFVTGDLADKEFREWVTMQDKDEIEEFLAVENLTYFDDRINLMKLELNKMI